MKGLRMDRDRALRVAAMIGLAVLAASILPGLLRPPEPPPLAPDVGFTRAETEPVIARPPERSHDGRAGLGGRGESVQRKAVKRRRGKSSTDPRPRGSNSPAAPTSVSAADAAPSLATPSPSGGPSVATPPRAPAPAPSPAPKPAASPAPSPAPRPPPTDGSQEFAPR